MRLLPQGCLRRYLCCALLLALIISGFWIYLVATSDALNSAFRRLRPNMNRAEVESTLGEPARQIQEIRGSGPYIDYDSGDIPVWPPNFPNIGKLTNDVSAIKLPDSERRPITAEHTWDGPEGRIIAAFDCDDQLVAVWLIHRVTWRYKVQRWLPWFK